MHELGITKKILAVVLDRARENNVRKVLAIRLAIGELSDREDTWLQRYFVHLSRNTLAEGAVIHISRIPVQLECARCGDLFQMDIWEEKSIRCPECAADDVNLVSGDEYTIEDMEVI